jgi:hypothetical protein
MPGGNPCADLLKLAGCAVPDPMKALLSQGLGEFVSTGHEHQIVANRDPPVTPAKIGAQQLQ